MSESTITEEATLFTPEQLAEWKKQYGKVYRLTSGDKQCIIFDPLTNLLIMKQAFTAINKSSILYVQVILNQCWLVGDEEMKNDEAYGNDLSDRIDQITDIPRFTITRKPASYLIECEGEQLEVRGAKRSDTILAEQKNRANEPFETPIALLDAIAIDKKQLERVTKNTRAFIGILTAVEEVKNKKATLVEEL